MNHYGFAASSLLLVGFYVYYFSAVWEAAECFLAPKSTP
jgi:hypothetical protein